MKTCPVCGGVVPQGRGYKSTQKYCNQECFRNRIFHGKHDEIIRLLNKNNNVTVTAQLMGLDRATLYAYLKRNNIRRRIEWVAGPASKLRR